MTFNTTDTDDDEERFAFGLNYYDPENCGCPAVQAGELSPDEGLRSGDVGHEMIEMYDDLAGTSIYADPYCEYGSLPEKEAKRAWIEAMDKIDEQADREFGERVANELGWL